MASETFKEKGEEELYQQGIKFRNENKIPEAIDCFLPLANKGYVRAQHNLAMKYLDLKEDREAYQWFKTAAEVNFAPSLNNLGKMNLLYILLPDEILSIVLCQLSMKDLMSFKTTSSRAQRIVDYLITSTNYLKSDQPYAKYVTFLFSTVVIEPTPKAIRVQRLVRSKEGSIEIHFRDREHLKAIVESIPMISPHKYLYFIRDENIEDGKELISRQGKLEREYFINVIADSPLKMKGNLSLSCSLNLPTEVDVKSMIYKVRKINFGEIKAYQNAYDLSEIIDSFNEQLFQIKTGDAFNLLQNRIKDRFENPASYKDLKELCPEFDMLSGAEINTISKDYIVNDSPLFYIADSIQSMEELMVKLPEFKLSVKYIDSNISTSGVYSNSPLYLREGFEIYTEGYLFLLGTMYLPNYNISFSGVKGVSFMGLKLNANGMNVSSGDSIYMGELRSILAEHEKPKYIPVEEWKRFLKVGKENGWFGVI